MFPFKFIPKYFADVFRGYISGTLVENGLKLLQGVNLESFTNCNSERNENPVNINSQRQKFLKRCNMFKVSSISQIFHIFHNFLHVFIVGFEYILACLEPWFVNSNEKNFFSWKIERLIEIKVFV